MHSQAINTKTWIPLCLLGLLSLLIAGCGGSKSFDLPEPPTDTISPTVDNFNPDEDNSEDFEVDYKVEIIFSELMNLDSLTTEGGIKLFSGKNELDSDVDLEERDASISFSVVPLVGNDLVSDEEIIIPATKAILAHASERFALNTDYTVKIDVPARDIVEDDLDTSEDERNFFLSPFTIDFTTEEGEWKQSKDIPNVVVENKNTSNESIVSIDANQFAPTLISNSKGDTFLVWRQELSPGINQLWISRYLANTESWNLTNKSDLYCSIDTCANAHLLSEISSTSVIDYDVAINENGQLAVAWSQSSLPGEYVSIWAALFDGKAWYPAEEISDTGFPKTGHASTPNIALDSTGNAISVWQESIGEYSRIKTNIFKVGAGLSMQNGQWTEAPSFISNQPETISKKPSLSMNSKGLAVAVWEQNNNVYSNHIRLYQSNDWVSPERIDNINTTNPEYGIGSASQPTVQVDENNDAIAVWLKHDGQRNNVWFNRFTGSWGGFANYLEESRLGDASFPGITIGKHNKAMAYWVQEDSTGNTRSLYTSFFTAFSGWEAESLMVSDSELSYPTGRFDREGNAIIIWQEGLTKGDIKTRYYSKRTDNWDSEETLASNGANVSLAPLFEDGRFLATWINQENTQYRLKSVLFSD